MTDLDKHLSNEGLAKPKVQLLHGFCAGALLAFVLRCFLISRIDSEVGKSLIDIALISAKGGVWGLWCSRVMNVNVPRFLGILVVVFGAILVVPCIESPMGVVPLGTAYMHDHERNHVYFVNHVCASILVSVAVDLFCSARSRRKSCD